GEILATKNVKISRCTITGCLNFGIEIFYAEDVQVISNHVEMPLTEEAGYPVRNVRFVGAKRGIITGNTFIGGGDTNDDVRGVEAGLAQGYANPAYTQSPESLTISGNKFYRCYSEIYIGDCK